jgi:hypothetical protein
VVSRGAPLSCLVAFPVDFFFSGLLFPEKITWQKVWVRLTSGRSMEVKNMQKEGNLLRSVKTK